MYHGTKVLARQAIHIFAHASQFGELNYIDTICLEIFFNDYKYTY